METQTTLNRRNILNKTKKEISCSMISYYTTKLQYSTVSFYHKHRYIDKQNQIENPETNPHLYGQLIYDKGGKNIQWRKYSFYNKYY